MSVLRLRVTLEDIEPAVLRRIEVPEAMRLDRLHLVLQAAMPWQNYHLWEFAAGKTRWGLPDPDYGDDVRPAAKATLADAIGTAGATAFDYLYDFGDSWQHRIVVEDRIEPDPRHLYPRLTDVEGRCPPEDVGGFPDYDRFLDILADQDDPEYAETLEWHGGPFNPNVPPAEELRLDPPSIWWTPLIRSAERERCLDGEDETGVHARVQTGGGCPAGERWPTADADCGRTGDSTVHAEAMARDADERLPAAAVGIAGSGAREAGRISVRPGGRDRPLAA